MNNQYIYSNPQTLNTIRELSVNRTQLVKNIPQDSPPKFFQTDLIKYIKAYPPSGVQTDEQIVQYIQTTLGNPQYSPRLLYPYEGSLSQKQQEYMFFEDYLSNLESKRVHLHCLNLPSREYREANTFYSSTRNNILFDAEQISRDMRSILAEMYYQHVSKDAIWIDYYAFNHDERFNTIFRELTWRIALMDTYKLFLNENLLKCFFINLYNMLMIHSRIAHAEHTHIFDILKQDRHHFFGKYHYLVGGELFTLNDIMYGVFKFKENYAHTLGSKLGFKLLRKKKILKYQQHDPRNKFFLTVTDPRILFTLTTGDKSSVPLRIYNEKQLDWQLDNATKVVCGTCVIEENSLGGYSVSCPKLFKHAKRDFGLNKFDRLRYILTYKQDPVSLNLLTRLSGYKNTDKAILKSILFHHYYYDYGTNRPDYSNMLLPQKSH